MRFILIDGNGRVGSLTSILKGPCNAEIETANDAWLHYVAAQLEMSVANTFWDSAPTWCDHRIDFVLAPEEQDISGAGTLASVNLSTAAREDHCVAFTTAEVCKCRTARRRKPGFDPTLTRDPARCQLFELKLGRLEAPGYGMFRSCQDGGP